MPDSLTLSRRSCVMVLLAGLVSAQSAVFFSGRTLLPLAPSFTTQAGVPFEYSGPVSHGSSAIDPAGSLNVSYLFDVYSLASFKEGTLPFWNPYQGLGQPQLANGLSAVLYPLNLLFFVVPHTWWDVVYLLNWLLAAFFVTEYLRLIGVGREGMLIGGVTVLGSGFFQYYFAMREVVAVAAWFPLLLYALERTARDPRWRLRHWVLAVAVGCCLTAGQPESSFIALALSGVYAVVTMALGGAGRWRFAIACMPGTIVGLLVSAPFWLSFSDYAFRVHSNHPSGSHMSEIALGWWTAGTYVLPLLYGPLHSIPLGLSVPGWNWDYSPGWMPAIAALLALIGLAGAVRERQRPILLTAAMGGVIAAKIWGLPGATLMAKLPLFDRVVYPRYAAFVVAVCAAILAGVGFERLQAMHRRRAAWLTASWIAIVVVLYASTGVWTLAIFESPEVRQYSELALAWAVLIPLGLLWIKWRGREQTMAVAAGAACLLQLAAYMPGYAPAEHFWLSVWALGGWGLGLVALGLRRSRISQRAAIAVAAGGIAFLGIVAPRLVTAGLPRRYDALTMPPYLEELRKRQRLGERVYALDANPQPNFGAALRAPSVNTLEILAPTETARFINTYLDRSADPLWLSGTTGGRRSGDRSPMGELKANERYFDLIGVRYLTTSSSAPAAILHDTTTATSAMPAVRPLFAPAEAWLDGPELPFEAVEVYLSTYARANPGTVRLTIVDDSHRILGVAAIDGPLVEDNNYAVFHFPGLQPNRARRIGLRLTFEPAILGAMLAVWEYPPEAGTSFVFRVLGKNGQLRKILTDRRTGVGLWERTGALPRAFLATDARVVADSATALTMLSEIQDLRREVLIDSGPELRNDHSTPDPGELMELRLSPNHVFIRYEARTAGILTLTDSYSPGWTATVNGSPSQILRVDGVFRGVRIPAPGAYVVEYAYRPPRWTLSCGLAIVGFIALGMLTLGRGRA
jgi:Bacterial membrane protein YfhO